MLMPVFKSGNYPQGDFPLERCRKMVDAYDPVNNIEGAAVIGHMDNILAERIENEFAYGWYDKLSMDEEGTVYANFPDEDISPELSQWIKSGKLRYVSAEIITYDKKDSTKAPYLARVAFLGRSIPAVNQAKVPAMFSGLLKAIGFSKTDPVSDTGEPLLRFCQRMDKQTVQKFASLITVPLGASENSTSHSVEGGKQNTDEKPIPPKGFSMSMTDEEKEKFSQLEKENADKAARIAQFEQQEKENKKETAKKDAESFYQKFRDDGKITPVEFSEVVGLDVTLTEEQRAIQRKHFSALFEKRSPVVSLNAGHVASKEQCFSENEKTNASVNAQVRKYAREHKISFSEAVDVLSSEKPELFGGEQ